MTELVIIGGGPAGMGAAVAAYDQGIRDILILERDECLGGILQQCIHNGFGLHRFGEELTGPEYAWRYEQQVLERRIPVKYKTMVLSVSSHRVITATNEEDGIFTIEAKAIVLAMGCRERSKGALNIAGTRPAGIYSAGTAQKLVNQKGYLPGKDVVILGSGDIGLIMARRMTLEGAKVLACVEVMPYSGGLNRNIVQCLHDYDIPLYLSHTVTDIRGKDRVEQVVVSQVDANRNPIPGTEMVFDCDTLLLSVGLIPENELTRQAGIEIDRRTNGAVVYENMETSLPGVFACGNVCHVHDLVDFVTAESRRAGEAAARYVLEGGCGQESCLEIKNGDGVTYTVPQRIRPERVEKFCDLFFRVNRVCRDSEILVTSGEELLARFRREHLAPGEMEHIVLPRALLDKAREEITVSVREVEA